MDVEVAQKIKTLAHIAETQGRVLVQVNARQELYNIVLCALMASHPNPAGFAMEVRRWSARAQWTLVDGDADPEREATLDSLLSALESASPVELNLRAPKS
jgi:hypothetical protein